MQRQADELEEVQKWTGLIDTESQQCEDSLMLCAWDCCRSSKPVESYTCLETDRPHCSRNSTPVGFLSDGYLLEAGRGEGVAQDSLMHTGLSCDRPCTEEAWGWWALVEHSSRLQPRVDGVPRNGRVGCYLLAKSPVIV